MFECPVQVDTLVTASPIAETSEFAYTSVTTKGKVGGSLADRRAPSSLSEVGTQWPISILNTRPFWMTFC